MVGGTFIALKIAFGEHHDVKFLGKSMQCIQTTEKGGGGGGGGGSFMM